ncbi:peptide/nickel transport system ATP-binding protein/oligopeptide transport system ATP-binding protein [Evansella caseinilytica]|uniref:Peptide/nickel transport system ATP-binding protein/oligopeptide transport system ATP-binding protein n=1 Tax=Evansella caseinilytica TaxID=1503961 RepID=A0A1H3V0Z8_9BACI|nr:dipeptide ABC transporter ATP-binding protein [Evansella caseinilytica]SDZ68383.1 peptide/nickel transport system ATP-binding protein/oligopeptide transport system ATP-binding protein [Evansella caseinilytica]
MSEALLQVQHLKKYFAIPGSIFSRNIGKVKAVDDVSFDVHKGEVLGIVGESGCGKSTTGKALLRLIEPTAGQIFFNGEDITRLSEVEMRKIRRDMQIIFQDPYASLNPRHKIEKILSEPLLVHGIGTKESRRRKVSEILEVVGLSGDHAKRYPHQFSGGQRQRIGIARALIVKPKLIICDEPVSALDVSIQSQILNLMEDLQEEFGLTYVFIAHDLSVVHHISDRIGVMYLGRMVELAENEALYKNPYHPYTKSLLSAVPNPDPDIKQERIILQGDVPSPAEPPSGCAFHTRCPECMDICKSARPDFQQVTEDHFVACHLYGDGFG